MPRGRRSARAILTAGRLLAGLAWLGLGPAAEAASPAAAAPAPGVSSDAVLAHLNAVVRWYRQSQGGSQWVLQPNDAYFWTTQHGLAGEVVQQAFKSAEAEAPLVASGAPAGTAVTPAESDAQRLNGELARIKDRLGELREQIGELDRTMAAKPAPSNPDPRIEQRAALVAEANLYTAMEDSLQQLAAFIGSTGEEDLSGFGGQVKALQHTVPEAYAAGAASPPGPSANPADTGLIARSTQLFTLARSRYALGRLIDRTETLQAGARELLAPLRAAMGATITEGQAAAGRVDSAGPGQWATLSGSLNGQAARFRAIAAAVLPLRQEVADLGASATNLRQWQLAFDQQYDAIIRVLIGRAATVLAAIVILVVVSEIWRRATFRYIHDIRRRRQFLVVRRFATGVLMVVVIVMGFVSDFSSLATFAGFITAGIAVALQTIILSVAAYFFLIGRYGVRVGDRITVSGVTGDVIDVGLVRVYLMELAGAGVDLHQTGRVVVFPNSVLFQSTPFYKQIPGTDYTWHQVLLALAPDGDQELAQRQVLAAVAEVYGKYRDRLERQHHLAERLTDVSMEVPGPVAQVQFGDGGPELAVRYPVETRHIAEIDGAVARGVAEAIRRDAKLKAALAGPPRIRSAVKP